MIYLKEDILKDLLCKAFEEGVQSPYEFKNEVIGSLLKFAKEQSTCKVDNKLYSAKDQSICETDRNGNRYWHNKKGQRHRLDGHAVEHPNGTKAWFQNGQLHRLDGHAIEYADGTNSWLQNNKLHRLDGPAIEYASGNKEYWVEGKYYSEEDFTKKFGEKAIKN